MPTKPPGKSSSFVRVADIPQMEQFRVESLDMIPKLLVERFGEPSPGDGNKVSGMFIFADEQGNVFSIYDWMMTSPSGSTDVGFSPDDFWGLGEIVPLQIGGNSHNRQLLNKFLSWFDCALADGLQADQDWLAALPAEPCSAEAQSACCNLSRRVAPSATRRIASHSPHRQADCHAETARKALATIGPTATSSSNSTSCDLRLRRFVSHELGSIAHYRATQQPVGKHAMQRTLGARPSGGERMVRCNPRSIRRIADGRTNRRACTLVDDLGPSWKYPTTNARRYLTCRPATQQSQCQDPTICRRRGGDFRETRACSRRANPAVSPVGRSGHPDARGCGDEFPEAGANCRDSWIRVPPLPVCSARGLSSTG